MIPGPLAAPLEALVHAGGRPYIVGGAVRDHLLRLEPKGHDVETFGLGLDDIARVLERHGKVDTVGKSFGVVKLFTEGEEYDFSIPRRDQKTGVGHRGFSVEPDPGLSLRDAAMRRDFTINSIYWDPATQSVEDPLGGVRDLRAGILRHTGPAFSEDPLCVLRAFQFCARFNFSVAPETVQLVHPTLQGEFVFFVSRGFACGSGYLRNISCI